MLFDKGAFLQHFMRNVLKTSVITSHTTLPNALSKKIFIISKPINPIYRN